MLGTPWLWRRLILTENVEHMVDMALRLSRATPLIVTTYPRTTPSYLEMLRKVLGQAGRLKVLDIALPVSVLASLEPLYSTPAIILDQLRLVDPKFPSSHTIHPGFTVLAPGLFAGNTPSLRVLEIRRIPGLDQPLILFGHY